MNQIKLLKIGQDNLKQNKIEEAEIKASRLLEFILKQTRSQFIMKKLEEVSEENQKQYIEKIDEIIEGKPLQYITNKQEFMGLDFYVDKNVLIPQPDTEIIVEETIKILKQIESKEKQVLDLCTGSGAIAVSLAYYYKNIKILATDISKEALNIAKKNAKKHNVEEKINFIQSNLFNQIPNQKFNIIVSNPPYIKTDEIKYLSKEVQQEPNIALDGGKDGIVFYKAILEKTSIYLKKNGYLLFEIGYNQANSIFKLFEEIKQKELEIITKNPIKDLGGNNRVIIFQKKVK